MSEAYEKMRRPPVSALREIKGGRMNGKTDINPQWRYEIMDATFGACGIGWKYEIVKLWTEPGAGGQVMCFSEIKVYTKTPDGWSDPIPGIGGSMLIEQESKGLHVSDEGFKMATTDALSVALKMLGVAADIYAGRWDGTKYRDDPKDTKTDDKTLAEKKGALIDWLQADPPVFNDAQRKYAEDAIASNNIAAMDKALAGAKKKAGEVKA